MKTADVGEREYNIGRSRRGGMSFKSRQANEASGRWKEFTRLEIRSVNKDDLGGSSPPSPSSHLCNWKACSPELNELKLKTPRNAVPFTNVDAIALFLHLRLRI